LRRGWPEGVGGAEGSVEGAERDPGLVIRGTWRSRRERRLSLVIRGTRLRPRHEPRVTGHVRRPSRFAHDARRVTRYKLRAARPPRAGSCSTQTELDAVCSLAVPMHLFRTPESDSELHRERGGKYVVPRIDGKGHCAYSDFRRWVRRSFIAATSREGSRAGRQQGRVFSSHAKMGLSCARRGPSTRHTIVGNIKEEEK